MKHDRVLRAKRPDKTVVVLATLPLPAATIGPRNEYQQHPLLLFFHL